MERPSWWAVCLGGHKEIWAEGPHACCRLHRDRTSGPPVPADSLGPWLLWAAHFLVTHGLAAAAYTCFKSEGHGFVLTS